jgi:hypothetical protein
VNLGIAAVYTGGPEEAPLMDLQLRQIGRTTAVPYTVYAGALRLAPANRRRLGRNPRVRLFDCPATGLRGTAEHASALEPLIRHAVEGGSTHVCVLHMDSFPVRAGWTEPLARLIARGAAFVSVERIGTSCLFFGRNFFLRHRPALLVSADQRTSPLFRRYAREVKPLDHSGIGYGYRAFAEGLRWHALAAAPPSEFCGELHGGLVYHLGGVVRIGTGAGRVLSGSGYVRALASVTRLMRRLAGEGRWREWVGKIQWTRLSILKEALVEGPRVAEARRRLIEDEEGFFWDLPGIAEKKPRARRG